MSDKYKKVLNLEDIKPYERGAHIRLSSESSKVLREQYDREVPKLVNMALRAGYMHGRASAKKQIDRERVARREAFERVNSYKTMVERLGSVKTAKDLACNMYKIKEYDALRERYQKKCKEHELLKKRYKLQKERGGN